MSSVALVRGHTAMGEQGIQEGAKHPPLRSPRVEGQSGRGVIAYPHHLGAARPEVQDPVAKGGVQSQGPELGDVLGRHYGVER